MNDHPSVWLGDVISATIGVATLAQWLPPVAAAFTIIWTILRILESPYAQHLIKLFCERCVLPK